MKKTEEKEKMEIEGVKEKMEGEVLLVEKMEESCCSTSVVLGYRREGEVERFCCASVAMRCHEEGEEKGAHEQEIAYEFEEERVRVWEI